MAILASMHVERTQRGDEMFAVMAERRMPKVVRERKRLGEILIKTKRARQRPGDLRDL